jgi:hypothetical protein
MAVKDNDAGKPTIFEQPAIEAKEKASIKEMKILQKLNKVRMSILGTATKSGKNTFQKYDYFELKDFIPQVLKECDKYGLTAIYSVNEPTATLTIVNTDDPVESIEFSTPWVMSTGSNNPIQNLGSTHTYTRRYLWMMALELVETDQIDGQDQTKGNVVKAKVAEPVKAKVAEPEGGLITPEQVEMLCSLYNPNELKSMCASRGVARVEFLTAEDAEKAIQFRKGKK